MNKSLCIVVLFATYSYLQSAQNQILANSGTLIIPISRKKSQSLSPILTLPSYCAKYFSAQDIMTQLAIGLQIIDHLRHHPAHLSLIHRIKHCIRKQEDHADHKGVVEKSHEAAQEYITLLTPTVTSTQTDTGKTLTVTVNLEALRSLSFENRKQTFTLIDLITSKKFKPKKESCNSTLKKLQRLQRT